MFSELENTSLLGWSGLSTKQLVGAVKGGLQVMKQHTHVVAIRNGMVDGHRQGKLALPLVVKRKLAGLKDGEKSLQRRKWQGV